MDFGEFSIWVIIIAIVGFVIIGAMMFVRGLRPDPGERAETEPLTFKEGVQAYVGPVTPRLALLSPVKRVLLELVSATCGFPGFGWLVSGRVAIGLPMMVLGPAVVFGFYPVFLAYTGHFDDGPYVAIQYLPALGVISATALGVVEAHYARSIRGDS